MIRIDKGLDVPITGAPKQSIEVAPAVDRVALVAADYVGMRPTMKVEEGDRVKLGQLLFTDKKTAGVGYVSPAAGVVEAINRGAKRRFLSLVVRVEGDEQETFATFAGRSPRSLSREEVRDNLVASGLWTALQTRPYGKAPSPETTPRSLFITAIDTNPLAPDPQLVLEDRKEDFLAGIEALSRLTEGPTYLCRGPKSKIAGEELDCCETVVFDGPHPAGLPGTHIHFLDPVSLNKTVWYIGYQDVAAVGHLFLTGELDVRRVISLAGPSVKDPRLLRTRIGAHLQKLVDGQLVEGKHRVISGSVLSGRAAAPPTDFLGRRHQQVSVLAEGVEREFMGWAGPGFDKFSIKPVYASAWTGGARKFGFTTSTHGNRRAMVPIGMYEQVMPLDILPTFLLRSLITSDSVRGQELGCLELDEEDLALCTFVCPGKYDYGPMLREMLTQIEVEG